jgi:protease-4
MNYRLAHILTKDKWAIEPLFAKNNLMIVANILDGRTEIEATEEKDKPYSVVSKLAPKPKIEYFDDDNDDDDDSSSNDFSKAPSGSVAIVPIVGPLMKADAFCGPVGMATIGKRIKYFDSLPNISAIVLHIDSPGGTVDGTADLADIVKNTSKPILAFVDGMMCSAAAWIGTGAKEIMANNDFAEVGSIGVMMSFFDVIPYYEKEGYKYHQLVSSLSEDKTKIFDEIRAGKYENYIKEDLDPLAVEFQRVIRENRPTVKPEHLTGKVFFAKDVMGVFVDSIGTLDDAVDRAYTLAEIANSDKKSQSQNTKSNNSKSMKNYPLLNAVLNTELEVDAEESISLNADQLDIVESTIEEKNTAVQAVSDITAERDNVITERDNAIAERDNTIAERDNIIAERDALQSQIAEKDSTIADLQSKIPGAEAADHSAQEEVTEKNHAISDEAEQKMLENMPISDRVIYLKNKHSK